MKNLLLALALFSIIMVMSCGDGNVLERTDPEIQAAEDSATIVNYLADLGYEGGEVGVLSTGVRYVILDSGNMESIGEGDIVTFDYIGKLTNDTIFDTTIKEVADSIRMKVTEDTVGKADNEVTTQINILNAFPESRTYAPLRYTYAASGWTINGQFIDGFADGASATFRQLKVGGRSLIVIPSAEAYGTQGSGFLIGRNTVIAFELRPTNVVKQK